MEETVIVVMLKNKETGFLESEIGTYSVGEGDSLIYNIYAAEEGSGTDVHMRLTVDRDLEDWEFSAVLDYYDMEVLAGICKQVTDDDANYNPVWEVVFDFIDSQEGMEEKISAILAVHKAELDSVFETIADLEEEYK